MRKFFRTLLLIIGLSMTSVMTPNSNDELLNAIKEETLESLHLLRTFNVNILESYKIKEYPVISPIAVSDITRVSSEYGPRIHPIYNKKSIHRGVDLASPKGSIVRATGDGIVTGIKKWGGYGKQIVIEHKHDYSTRYAHLSKILVNKGDTVCMGDTIGAVGSTGLSTGNHLHYEISYHNKHIDPFSIYPDTLHLGNYLEYYNKINKHLLSCSDNVELGTQASL
jgi:murein DD-endopeptidase MepM/ murein hydrolase activator NlpD